jgi:hypothetical protein
LRRAAATAGAAGLLLAGVLSAQSTPADTSSEQPSTSGTAPSQGQFQKKKTFQKTDDYYQPGVEIGTLQCGARTATVFLWWNPTIDTVELELKSGDRSVKSPMTYVKGEKPTGKPFVFMLMADSKGDVVSTKIFARSGTPPEFRSTPLCAALPA